MRRFGEMMACLERLIDARKTIEGKILSVIMTFVLVFSIAGLPVFSNTALADSDTTAGLKAYIQGTDTVQYNATVQKPTVVVEKDGTPLVEGQDYTCEWNNDSRYAKQFFHAHKYNCAITLTGDTVPKFNLSYEITKAPLYVVTDSAERAYNGKDLTASGHLEGLISNYESTDVGGAEIKEITGKQKEIGSSTNTYSGISYKQPYIQNDYYIVEKLGTLTVTCDHDTWTGTDLRWDFGEVASTCTQEGYRYKECTQCGEKIKTAVLPATGHSFVDGTCLGANGSEHPDGCTSDKHQRVCVKCNGAEDGGIVEEPHAYGDWVEAKPATYDEEGLEVRTCTVCGHKQSQVTPTLPYHTVTFVVVNGAWNDETTAPLAKKFGKQDDLLTAADYPEVGAHPSRGYKEGSWDQKLDRVVLTADATYTYTYELETYTISYTGLEDATIDGENPVAYTVEDDTISIINPTREGYIFAGWIGEDLTEPTQDLIIEAGSIGDREYEATWEQEPVTPIVPDPVDPDPVNPGPVGPEPDVPEPIVPDPTPDAPVTPTTDTPVTPTTDAPVAPATPAPAVPAAPAAPTAATPATVTPAATTIEDDANPLADATDQVIADDENPLGAFDEPHCWVHWFMLIGIVLTVIYGAIVLIHRKKSIDDFTSFEKKVLRTSDRQTRNVYARNNGYQAI